MVQEVPYIARMIIIQESSNIRKTDTEYGDISYSNANLDSECEYCLNTMAWD